MFCICALTRFSVHTAWPKLRHACDAGTQSPPLTVAALNLKTWMNPATGTSEIVAASVVHLPAMRVDVPFPKVAAAAGPRLCLQCVY